MIKFPVIYENKLYMYIEPIDNKPYLFFNFSIMAEKESKDLKLFIKKNQNIMPKLVFVTKVDTNEELGVYKTFLKKPLAIDYMKFKRNNCS